MVGQTSPQVGSHDKEPVFPIWVVVVKATSLFSLTIRGKSCSPIFSADCSTFGKLVQIMLINMICMCTCMLSVVQCPFKAQCHFFLPHSKF